VDEATRTGGQAVGDGTRGPEEIRQDIEQTREELGETVEALAAKTDVKAQARAKVDDTKDRARAAVESKVDVVKQRLHLASDDSGAPTQTVEGPGVASAGAPTASARPDAATRLRTDPKPFVLAAVVAAGLLLLWRR
jgi:hypothetical protein